MLQSTPFPDMITIVANCLNEKQKITTLAILADLAMADRMLAGDEQKILQTFMENLAFLRPL